MILPKKHYAASKRNSWKLSNRRKRNEVLQKSDFGKCACASRKTALTETAGGWPATLPLREITLAHSRLPRLVRAQCGSSLFQNWRE
jgi:hypothetical protein